MLETPVQRPGLEVLRWLLRYRWLAVAGQGAALVVATAGFGLRFEALPVVMALVLLALSNHFLIPDLRPGRSLGPRLAGILGIDLVLLTWMLFWTGGTENPAIVCYLLNLALAGMLLGRRALWILGLLSGAGLLWLLLAAPPFRGAEPWVIDGRLEPTLRRAGTVVLLGVTGAVLLIWVHPLRQALVRGERALRETSRQLEEMERFKALATLSAGVAHELATPLGTIAVAARELERNLGARSQVSTDDAEDAALIRREVERCRGILQHLDRRSTAGTGSAAEWFDFDTLAGALRERLQAAQLARLEMGCDRPEQRVRLPLEAVVRSLVVLVENACEADESGRPVRLTATVEADQWRCRVCDRGAGVPKAVRHRVGEPFFTTKSGERRGLGLFLVRTLTLELGGEISLDPIADGGTCANLRLPVDCQHALLDGTAPGGR